MRSTKKQIPKFKAGDVIFDISGEFDYDKGTILKYFKSSDLYKIKFIDPQTKEFYTDRYGATFIDGYYVLDISSVFSSDLKDLLK